MNPPRPRRRPRPSGLRLALLLVLPALGGCREAPPAGYQGYLEAEFVHVGAPLAGRLLRLDVERGQEVAAGGPLFELESAAEAAAVEEAGKRLAQATARLDNLRKGRRPSELAAIQAQLERAEASARLASADLARREELRRGEVISASELDASQARRDTEAAQVEALRAELQTAGLGAREDELRAAEADEAAAAAALVRARWALDNKRQITPEPARVHDTLYRPGEFVAAGMPVVSLLPPGNLKARFFVPETAIAGLRIGGPVQLRLDGLPAPVPATITYIASQAEYTPPVIYSRENRAKLVFMVEARPSTNAASGLRPGQPVDVTVPR